MNKSLNKDMQLKHVGYGFYDVNFNDGDLVSVTDEECLINGLILSILTRYDEIPLTNYTGFGCHVHELIKDNQTELTLFKLKSYLKETIAKIHRVKSVDNLSVDVKDNSYFITVTITSITDEVVTTIINGAV